MGMARKRRSHVLGRSSRGVILRLGGSREKRYKSPLTAWRDLLVEAQFRRPAALLLDGEAAATTSDPTPITWEARQRLQDALDAAPGAQEDLPRKAERIAARRRG